ncbi:hypothetical protein F2Q69_00038291 [Brassica cretica]|uniref:DUF7865 domain-containing protein n=2 Tax=Brassica cretica TaxID=69181 RepID=A0A3N6Q7R9_BRACR|nr:hypothetical protein DY000_02042979 [Brassica cretica]KAF3603943.1 hypothetical protein F2Q69_00038291 [Brassica cretica]
MNSHLFRVICILHSVIALTSGTLMMFYTEKASIFGHGSDIANKLKGSTPHDELLIQISQSFSGLLLFAIGLVLFMVSFVKDREFHGFFAGGSVILYVLMALWRVVFEWKIEDLAFECPKQALGDIALAVSWVSVITFIGAPPFSSSLLCLAVKVKAFFCSSLSLDDGKDVSILDLRMSNQPAKDGVIPPPISDSKAAAAETKPKKKICCACPDTKKLRDECIVEHGESACAKWIEAHKMCLRAEGFNV